MNESQNLDLSHDPVVLSAFRDGTIFVLETQCQVKVTAGVASPKVRSDLAPAFDIAGLIGLTSQTYSASIAICFPEAIFLKLMSNMLGEEFKKIDQDLEDGAAELLNMIFGHAKKVLNERGHTIEKSLPTVLRGEKLSISHANQEAPMVLSFDVEGSKFFLEIGTHRISN